MPFTVLTPDDLNALSKQLDEMGDSVKLVKATQSAQSLGMLDLDSRVSKLQSTQASHALRLNGLEAATPVDDQLAQVLADVQSSLNDSVTKLQEVDQRYKLQMTAIEQRLAALEKGPRNNG